MKKQKAPADLLTANDLDAYAAYRVVNRFPDKGYSFDEKSGSFVMKKTIPKKDREFVERFIEHKIEEFREDALNGSPTEESDGFQEFMKKYKKPSCDQSSVMPERFSARGQFVPYEARRGKTFH